MSDKSSLYLDKYLKYKAKYLKLKEQLGGVNPKKFNPGEPGERKIDELYTIIANLLADMFIHNVCNTLQISLDPGQKAELEDYINRGFFKPAIQVMGTFRDTINKLIIDSFNKTELYIGYASSKYDTKLDRDTHMTMLGFKIPELSEAKLPDENFYRSESNLHISFNQTSQQIGSNIYYHGTYAYKENGIGPFKTVHYNTESEMFSMLTNLYKHLSVISTDGSMKKYLKCIIILSIISINFGVNDDSRNSLDQILIQFETNPELIMFIPQLLGWLKELFLTLVSQSFIGIMDLKPKGSITDFLSEIKKEADINEAARIKKEQSEAARIEQMKIDKAVADKKRDKAAKEKLEKKAAEAVAKKVEAVANRAEAEAAEAAAYATTATEKEEKFTSDKLAFIENPIYKKYIEDKDKVKDRGQSKITDGTILAKLIEYLKLLLEVDTNKVDTKKEFDPKEAKKKFEKDLGKAKIDSKFKTIIDNIVKEEYKFTNIPKLFK